MDDLAPLELKSRIVENSLLSCLGSIISCFKKRYYGEDMGPAWLEKDKESVLFFMKKSPIHSTTESWLASAP